MTPVLKSQTPASKIKREAIFWKGCTRFPRLTENEKTTAASIHIDHVRAKAAIRTAVETLCAGEPRNFRNHERLAEAGDFIFTEFQRFGYNVARQPYDVQGRSYFNVVAEPPADPAKPLVIIGAHYDVCGNTPGADDNASAIAVMLSLAENWKTLSERARVRLQFVAYTLEEPPFFNTDEMGSRVHARSLPPGDPPEFMLTLDCVGYYNDGKRAQKYPVNLARVSYPSVGNFLFSITNPSGKKNAKKFYSLARDCGNLRVEYVALPSATVNFSDHYSYWKHHIPAFVLTDTAWFRNPHYHQLSDTPETLDYARLAETVQLLARYLAAR
jgi:Zn-dependent M28 family amino/carboxypeptidase